MNCKTTLTLAKEAFKQKDLNGFWSMIWSYGPIQAYKWLKEEKWLPQKGSSKKKNALKREALKHVYASFLLEPTRLEKLLESPIALKWIALYFQGYHSSAPEFANLVLQRNPDLAIDALRGIRFWSYSDKQFQAVLNLEWRKSDMLHIEIWKQLHLRNADWNTLLNQVKQSLVGFSKADVLRVTEKGLSELKEANELGIGNFSMDTHCRSRQLLVGLVSNSIPLLPLRPGEDKLINKCYFNLHLSMRFLNECEDIYAFSKDLDLREGLGIIEFKSTRKLFLEELVTADEYRQHLPSDSNLEVINKWLRSRGWATSESHKKSSFSISHMAEVLLHWKSWASKFIKRIDEVGVEIVSPERLLEIHPGIFSSALEAKYFLELMTAPPKGYRRELDDVRMNRKLPLSPLYKLDESRYAWSAQQMIHTNMSTWLYTQLELEDKTKHDKSISRSLELKLTSVADKLGILTRKNLAKKFEEDKLAGDADIILQDNDAIALVQVKRAHLKLSLQDVHNEHIEADVLAVDQATLAGVSLLSGYSYGINESILKIVVSTSFEGGGELFDGAYKMSVERFYAFLDTVSKIGILEAFDAYKKEAKIRIQFLDSQLPEQDWIKLKIRKL